MLLGGTSSGENTASSGGQASQSPVSAQDRQISAAIRGAFSTDRELGRFAIGIRTAGRVVTLSGTVTSFSLRDRAVAIAGDAAGVTEVRNRIVVNSNAN